MDSIKFDLPNEFLQKWLVAASEGKTSEEEVQKDYDKYAQNEYRKNFFDLNNMEAFAENTRLIFSSIKKHVFIYNDIYDN